MGGGEVEPQFNNNTMGSPPMDDDIYNDMMVDVRGDGNPFVPTDYKRSNQSQNWESGEYE